MRSLRFGQARPATVGLTEAAALPILEDRRCRCERERCRAGCDGWGGRRGTRRVRIRFAWSPRPPWPKTAATAGLKNRSVSVSQSRSDVGRPDIKVNGSSGVNGRGIEYLSGRRWLTGWPKGRWPGGRLTRQESEIPNLNGDFLWTRSVGYRIRRVGDMAERFNAAP